MVGHDDKTIELIGMLGKYIRDAANLGLWILRRESKEDDSCMGKAKTNDQFAEVAVIGDENAPLTSRHLKYLFIIKTGRLDARDQTDIMTLLAQIDCDTKLDILIEQEFHRLACWASGTAAFLPLSSRSTASFANSRHALTSSMVRRG